MLYPSQSIFSVALNFISQILIHILTFEKTLKDNFLEFVNAELEESQQEYKDPFVARLQEKIRQIKSSRVIEGRFMVLKEMLQKEGREGYEEGQKKGKKEGQRQLLVAQVQKKIEKGKSIEQIADELEEDISAIRPIYDELVKNRWK